MAKYRLLADHVTSDGRVLPAGTEVGDDTPEPWGEPSNQMEPLDDDARDKVNELWQRLYGHEFVHPDAPVVADPARQEALQKSRDAETKAAADLEEEMASAPPVSDQQKAERERDAAATDPAPVPSPTRAAAPTRGGTRASPGPATPKVDEENVRPSNPNQDQYPKG